MTPRRIVFATRNGGKLREAREILGESWELVDATGLPDVVESGDTFEANAILKARSARDASSLPSLADDSGLEVDALEGRPGVRSARYGGPGLDDAGRRRLLLEEMSGVPPERRRARFVCAVALAIPGSDAFEVVRGTVEGRIATEERGSGGFGYDPVFIPEGHDASFGELPSETKHAMSHRGAALRAIRPMLERLAR